MTVYSYIKYVDDDRLSLEIRNSPITIALDSVNITGEQTVDIKFKTELSSNDKYMLDDLVESHINQPITVRDSVELANIDITSNAEKALKIAPTKLEGSSTQLVSHDFCDETTWFHDSVLVENEILSSENGLLYKSSQVSWIDLEHGKIPYEDRLSDRYRPIVMLNNIPINTGFTIDYKKGEVTFETTKQDHIVSVTYNYANGSTWLLVPEPGRILKILGTVIKFTSDVYLGKDQHILFQLFIEGHPFGQPTIYKNMKDILKCTMTSPTSLKGFSDIVGDVNFLPFDYITSKDLKSSLNMEIRIWLNNHIPFQGEFGVVTANCISVKE